MLVVRARALRSRALRDAACLHGIDRSAEQRDRVMRRAAGGDEAAATIAGLRRLGAPIDREMRAWQARALNVEEACPRDRARARLAG